MSTKTDHPDGPSTLPEPELNPLLNPVLGQHMGRWAEVYFTSPPEKREQAVLELLQELQGQAATAEGTASSTATETPEHEPVFRPVSKIPAVLATRIRCRTCGRENPASHRFCGMCGAPVAAQAEDDLPTTGNPRPSEQTSPPNNESRFAPSEEAIFEPAISTSELSLFQSGRDARYHGDQDDNVDEIFSYSPAPRSYRVYVGIALALVIFGLAYMAWRGAQSTAQNTHVEPQAPPAVTQPAAPAPAPSSASTSTSAPAPELTTGAPVGTPSANGQANALTDSGRGQVEPALKAGINKSAEAAPQNKPVAEAIPSEAPRAGNGAEELAMAQRYLTGENGLQRNSSEGAKWLWKSMAKHNASATLLLADLYLKGDGVSKNCDQARVLLDSAARGGMKQAGERLRHLQAFGCE